MKKRVFIAISLVILSAFLMAATPALSKLVRFTIVNRTGRAATIRMRSTDKKTFYYLQIKKGTNTYTVERKEYNVTVYGCGNGSRGGKIDLEHQVRLALPPCNQRGPRGESPSQLKARIYGTSFGDEEDEEEDNDR